MIKKYVLILLVVQSACKPQPYSGIIADHDIEAMIDYEIQQMLAAFDNDKFTPSKIARDIVDWHQIDELNIDSLHLIENNFPIEEEDTLKGMPELFDEKDFKFMALQISQNTGSRWQLPRGKIKFVNNCKMGCARYSIPLFNESRTKAIIYKEEVYNPIAACGLIIVYILEDHQWKEYKTMGIWLM